jgi:hypothetical protein
MSTVRSETYKLSPKGQQSIYDKILFYCQTIFLLLYVFLLPVYVSYKEVPPGYYAILYRIRPQDIILILFIFVSILRNRFQWQFPYVSVALIANVIAFSFATVISHVNGYYSQESYIPWYVGFCRDIYNITMLLVIFNYLMSISLNTCLLILRFIVICSTIIGLIGIYDMVAHIYDYPMLSFNPFYLIVNDAELLRARITKPIFMGTFGNQGYASCFYFIIAFLAMINMMLLPRNRKLVYGLFLWVPFTIVFLTLARTGWIAMIILFPLILMFSIFEKKVFISRLIQLVWIGFMTTILLLVFMSISPEFLHFFKYKFIGSEKLVVAGKNMSNMNSQKMTIDKNISNTNSKNKEYSASQNSPTSTQIDFKNVQILREIKSGFISKEFHSTFEAFNKHPLGYGYNGYTITVKGHSPLPIHNFYIRLVIEGGIFGIITGILFVITIIWEPFRNGKNNWHIKSIVTPFMIGLLIMATHTNIFVLRYFGFLMPFVLALTAIVGQSNREPLQDTSVSSCPNTMLAEELCK